MFKWILQTQSRRRVSLRGCLEHMLGHLFQVINSILSLQDCLSFQPIPCMTPMRIPHSNLWRAGFMSLGSRLKDSKISDPKRDSSHSADSSMLQRTGTRKCIITHNTKHVKVLVYFKTDQCSVWTQIKQFDFLDLNSYKNSFYPSLPNHWVTVTGQ